MSAMLAGWTTFADVAPSPPSTTDFGPGLIVGLILAALAVLIVLSAWLWPHRFLRALVWLITHSVYRIRVVGLENVPRTGGVLLVCNHISYVDWLLLGAASPRFIRFVMFAGYAKLWPFRSLLRWLRVIPIDESSGPRAILTALRTASEAIAAGEVVCIFAEGTLTRTGFMMPFHRGFEIVLKRSPAPIIPVCLDQVWGSIFSYAGGKAFWKIPQHIPYPVGVAFGRPMPATSNAAEVRLAIQKLSADWAVQHADEYLPVHRGFVRVAARHPFTSCVFDATRPDGLTYGKALAGAVCLRRWLKPILGETPMVALWLPPSVGGALANIAVAMLGKTSVNLNYSSGPESLQVALRQCGVKHVLTSKKFILRMKLDPGPGVELVYLEDAAPHITKSQQLRAFLAAVLLPGWLLDGVLGLRRHHVNDLATVIFSSGSTGEPKGVMLTHRNIASNALSCIQALHITKEDRILGILPFFHSFGFTVTMWAPLQVGASTVYYPDPRASKEIGEFCKKYRCNIFLSTPTFLRFNLRRCDPDDFRTLGVLVCGAEKLPQSLALEFQEKFGVLPLEGYGCTELSPVISAGLPEREVRGVRYVLTKPGSVGQPFPGIAVRIVDADNPAKVLPPGQEGLVLVYGANVMKGYLDRPDLTAKVILDGWYVTGDMGKIDEDGYIFLTGRLSRFAKIGGEMVPLEKIEETLHELLGTSERVLAVTCVPDETRGERLIVLYTNLNGQEPRTLSKGLSTKGLPNLWAPAERDWFQVPELPTLGSGKLDLKRVKETALRVTGSARVAPPHVLPTPTITPTPVVPDAHVAQ